jgi:ubiquinone/menaquinone biosynthesis C-methylase UbiE
VKHPDNPLAALRLALGTLEHKRVLDVGCGDGALVRALLDAGASAAGIDPNPMALAEAGRIAPASDFRVASAEQIPFPDHTFDAVVTVNSLHHVPVTSMDKALDEFARVIHPDGAAVVVEPLAYGSSFEALRLVHDETAIRHEAQMALKRAMGRGIYGLAETYSYTRQESFTNADAFLARVIAVDPTRLSKIRKNHAAISRAILAAASRSREGLLVFEQPIKVDVLRPIAK